VSESSQFSLLRQRRFAPFFATQFLGALNDNVFRNGLLFLLVFQGVMIADLKHSELANIAGALFILPFLLFSALAGQLADKYEKSHLIRSIKLAEIMLMVLAAGALWYQNYVWLLCLLFLMGTQSTLFGPVKYAYLPQNLSSEELIGGNGLLEAGTFIAIILGMIIGGLVVAMDPTMLAMCLIGFAVLGYLVSRRVPMTRAVDPALQLKWNIWVETWRIIGFSRADRSVFLAILGISWFWFFGSVVTLQLPAYTLDILRSNESVSTALLVSFIVGAGAGSLLCERLSGRRVELGLVPFGSIGLSLFAVDLYWAQPVELVAAVGSVGAFLAEPSSWRILFDLSMLGAFGAFYSVPLYALVQQRSKRQHLSRIIAANNILNSIFMIAAAAISIALLQQGFSIPQLFLVLAGLNVAVAIYIYSLLPEFLLRFFAWILVSLFYRIRLQGAESIPEKGPAVIVCNHVSFMDPIILSGCVRRPMRFVMYYRIFEMPVLKLFFKNMKAIPIASAREDEEVMLAAFEAVDAELAAGNLVCIFPEGAITRDGEVQRFRPGIEKIIERRAVPVVPVALGRLWGSWFSRRKDGGVRKIPGRLFARIPIRIGSAVPANDVSAAGLELLVRTLRGDDR